MSIDIFSLAFSSIFAIIRFLGFTNYLGVQVLLCDSASSRRYKERFGRDFFALIGCVTFSYEKWSKHNATYIATTFISFVN